MRTKGIGSSAARRHRHLRCGRLMPTRCASFAVRSGRGARALPTVDRESFQIQRYTHREHKTVTISHIHSPSLYNLHSRSPHSLLTSYFAPFELSLVSSLFAGRSCTGLTTIVCLWLNVPEFAFRSLLRSSSSMINSSASSIISLRQKASIRKSSPKFCVPSKRF